MKMIDEESIWETRDKTEKHELDIVNYPCDFSKNGEKDVSLFELLNVNVFLGENAFYLVSLAFRQKEGYQVLWLYKWSLIFKSKPEHLSRCKQKMEWDSILD